MCDKILTTPRIANKVNIERYNSLDGLRAYAALGIILMHMQANIRIKPSVNYLTERIIPFFSDFTLLFMMISGFSLCCGYYTRIKNGTITPNVFYKKRYIRILPFFASLCLIDLVIEHDIGSICEVFANMTLCFGLLPPDIKFHVIGVGWFLGVVFLFYMLFPFFFFFLDNKSRAWISLTLALIFVLVSFVHFDSPGRKCMVFCAPLFILGGIAYLYRYRLANIGKRYAAICAFTVLAITIVFFAMRGLIHNAFVNYICELILFSAWLVYAIGSKDVVLNNCMTKYLSGISMEIYLSHMLVYRVVEKIHLENFISYNNALYIVTSLLTIIGVICFAHVMKYHILQPMMKRIERR